MSESGLPEPHEVYERIRKEGERRLSRPLLELTATAFVAGVDVVFGIVALAVATASVSKAAGPHVAHLVGAIFFGPAFVFIVVGRSELFTENFLVPITGLKDGSVRKLLELWAVSPVANLVGGGLLLTIVSSGGVLPEGTGKAIRDTALVYDRNGLVTAFLSAIGAGALITLMTWLVEAANTGVVRVVVAWLAGTLLALGSFNHVIVVSLLFFGGLRYGAHLGWEDLFSNLGVAAAGNLIGGLLFVTLTRYGQALGASST